MQRVEHAVLRRQLAHRLTAAIHPVERNRLQLDASAIRAVVDSVMSALAGTLILRPDDVGRFGRPGRFGVDEPWPLGFGPEAPDLEPPTSGLY